MEPGNRGIVQRFGGETGFFVKGKIPQVGDSCILYPVDGSDAPVCIPSFSNFNVNDFVFLMPDFNFDFLAQFPSWQQYSPPPVDSYHDFRMYVSNTGRWIYGDSGEPDVFLKTDGSGWASPQALFGFLFEDARYLPADCYIDVRMVNNTHFEIWAGSINPRAVYHNTLYYKNTLLTQGTGSTMPTVHVILPI